ncbi:MAG: chemotaxis protein CheW, partial [bacterium]
EEPLPHKAIRRYAPEAERLVQSLQNVRSGSPDEPQTERAEPPPPKPLGERLMETHVISQEKLDAAVTSQKEKGGPLGEILMKEHDVRAVDIAHALRDQKVGKEESMEIPSGGNIGGSVTSDSIRVRVKLLDRLMGLAGELVLGRNQLLQKLDGVSDQVHGLNSLLHTMDRITSEVQEAVMQTRMQPLSGLFSRFHRVVRDLARSLNKKINLSIEGETVELDKTLIEALTDPLTHLVRNSADHGIETPETRTAAGKDPTGRLLISAYHQGGRVYVKIRDDGAGIDPEIIKAKAVEKGLITPEKSGQMTDREAMRLLFMAGFSTAEQVTGVSGRGVGMDVVISSIQSVGGTVEIDSEVGKGTTILLALPLTLAIVPALIVSAGKQRFAIPQTNLLELVYLEGEAAKDAILAVRGSEIYRLRGEMLPLVRLNRVLQLSGKDISPEEENLEDISIVVMADGQQQFGLIVERVFDTEEIVVQPLDTLLKDVGVFAGATLMGDGQPALILDITGLMKTAELTVSDDAAGAGMGEESEEAKAYRAEDETQTLLVFNINSAEQMAVPLTLISRLETVNVKDIRSSIHGDVIPYRDRLLPLIYMENHTNISPPPQERETVKILVFEIENPVGLVVTEIIDSLEVAVQLDESSITPPGFSGLAMVNDRPTAFVDIYQVIEKAFPDWFQQDRHQREGLKDKGQISILLVEDSSFYRNMEKSYLTQEGFKVLEAEHGKEALGILRRESVDLVVTDIEMPEMNGFQLTQEIRQDEQLRHLPVIAVTSLSKDEERQRGMDVGLDAYLIKLQREVLLKEVHRLLAESRA